MMERVTLNLTDRSSDQLQRLTGHTGQSKTDTINRAIQLYWWWVEQEAAGHEHTLREGDQIAVVRMF